MTSLSVVSRFAAFARPALIAGTCLPVWLSSLGAAPLEIDISTSIPPVVPSPLEPGTTKSPQGHAITMDSRSLRFDGEPYIPVCGEFHYARYPRSEWRDALLKMKAGGIDTVSTYVFWIYHEEERGKFAWDNNRSLGDFLKLSQDVGLKVIVRIGPWCHGEVRNGGVPDWVQKSGTKLRSNDPAFLELVKPFYAEIASQMKGLLWKDGGPVIAVQLDNEMRDSNYLLTLKKMAQDVGIDVPFYTMTGWNGANIPKAGLLPLFGAYSDGFWGGKPEDYRKGFMFSSIRDGGDLGAQMQNVRPSRNQHMVESFPFACAELGGGMMSAYTKRIRIIPDEIAALALVKLGSGNSMPGYYMYHGGINPDGKFSTLQEERPNAMPVKDYDFQAPIGAVGQVRTQFHLLREQHLFLHDFGNKLAQMPAYFPAEKPKEMSDFATFRWTMRADENGSGFLFLNNRQPVIPLADKTGVQFAIKSHTRTVVVPAKPLTIPSGAYGYWPVRFDCDGVSLEYATVQPLCRVVGDDDAPVYFFVAIEGVRPEIAIAGKAALVVTPGLQAALTAQNARGVSVQFVVLTPDQGRMFSRVNFAGRPRAILSKATVLTDGDTLRLLAEDVSDFQFALFPSAPVKFGGKILTDAPAGVFTRFEIPVSQPPVVAISATLETPAAPKATSLKGTDEGTWADAAVYSLSIPEAAKERRLRLDIDYVGDALRVYVGDKLIYDHFYNGEPCEFAFWRIAKADWPNIRLKLLPYSNALDSRLPKQATEKAASALAAGSLDKVGILAVDQLEANITP
jgi:beta-galactosidase